MCNSDYTEPGFSKGIYTAQCEEAWQVLLNRFYYYSNLLIDFEFYKQYTKTKIKKTHIKTLGAHI